MKLKCRSTTLVVDDVAFFSNKKETRTIENLTEGRTYTIFYNASFTTMNSNCLTFFNDKNEWQEIRHDQALSLFIPVDG